MYSARYICTDTIEDEKIICKQGPKEGYLLERIKLSEFVNRS
jgi:hypothetical protein